MMILKRTIDVLHLLCKPFNIYDFHLCVRHTSDSSNNFSNTELQSSTCSTCNLQVINYLNYG